MARQRSFLAVLLLSSAAAWSCDRGSADGPSECPLGSVRVGDACQARPVTAISACPDGAELVGDAPPKGLRQRCQKSETARHGASREWYPDHRERTYTEWWDGQKHGSFKFWYKSGQVRSEGAHAYGQPAGKWVYYAEDGKVRQEQTFPAAPPPASWLADAIAGRPPPPAPPQEPIVPTENKDAPPPEIRKPGAAASAGIALPQDGAAQPTE